MTKVSYILSNGTEVTTLREAQLSGLGYTMSYTKIPNQPSKLTEKQKARRIKI